MSENKVYVEKKETCRQIDWTLSVICHKIDIVGKWNTCISVAPVNDCN